MLIKTRLYLCFFALFINCAFEPSPEDILKNFNKNEETFYELESFIRAKKEIPNHLVFYSDKKVGFSVYKKKGTIFEDDFYYSDVANYEKPEPQKALLKIGWTIDDVRTVYELLKKANCFSIRYSAAFSEPKKVIEIGYKEYRFSAKRIGTIYMYLIFPEKISKAKMEQLTLYNHDETVHYIKPRIGWAIYYDDP